MTAQQLYERDVRAARDAGAESPYILRVAADIRKTAYQVSEVKWADLSEAKKRQYRAKAKREDILAEGRGGGRGSRR